MLEYDLPPPPYSCAAVIGGVAVLEQLEAVDLRDGLIVELHDPDEQVVRARAVLAGLHHLAQALLKLAEKRGDTAAAVDADRHECVLGGREMLRIDGAVTEVRCRHLRRRSKQSL